MRACWWFGWNARDNDVCFLPGGTEEVVMTTLPWRQQVSRAASLVLLITHCDNDEGVCMGVHVQFVCVCVFIYLCVYAQPRAREREVKADLCGILIFAVN